LKENGVDNVYIFRAKTYLKYRLVLFY